MDSHIKNLQSLKIGDTIEFNGLIIKACTPPAVRTNGSNTCSSCVHDHGNGALNCRFRNACFAHKRADRKPAIFQLIQD